MANWIPPKRPQKLGPVGREGRFVSRDAYQEAPRANTMDPELERPDVDFPEIRNASVGAKPGKWEERGTGRS